MRLMIGAALALIAGPALAADLPVFSEPIAPYIAPAAFSWTGLYVGANASYGIGRSDASANIDIEEIEGPDESIDVAVGDWWSGGGLLGAHVGYNYQFGLFVVGAEIAAAWSGVDGEDRATIDGPGFSAEGHLTTDLNWLATARAKAGVAFDRALLYAIGGVAWGEVNNTVGFGISTPRGSASDEWGSTETSVGWTIGLGLEYAVTDNIVVGMEYQHVDFGDSNTVTIDTDSEAVGDIPVNFNNSFDLVTAKVSYKF